MLWKRFLFLHCRPKIAAKRNQDAGQNADELEKEVIEKLGSEDGEKGNEQSTINESLEEKN